MPDSFTVTSSQGFLSRLTNFLAGLVIGPLLIIGAIVLLWWNEGRAVQAIVGLKDAASQVVEAQASGPSPANENKLIHGYRRGHRAIAHSGFRCWNRVR